jgi:hypothetical protein
MIVGNLRKFFFQFLCSTHGRITCRIILVFLFLLLLQLKLVKAHIHISLVFTLYWIIHICHVILHFFDSTNYLVVDGVNSLRQEHVHWYSRVLNPSSGDTPSTCASTQPTNAFSELQKFVGLAECHHAKVGRDWWVSGRTFAAPSSASRFRLPRLLGNTPSSVH